MRLTAHNKFKFMIFLLKRSYPKPSFMYFCSNHKSHKPLTYGKETRWCNWITLRFVSWKENGRNCIYFTELEANYETHAAGSYIWLGAALNFGFFLQKNVEWLCFLWFTLLWVQWVFDVSKKTGSSDHLVRLMEIRWSPSLFEIQYGINFSLWRIYFNSSSWD